MLKSENKADIDARAQALSEAGQKLGERMYADAQAKAQGGQGQGGEPHQAAGEAEPAKKDDGNVVDAEFTEVKDKKTGS